MKKTSAILQLLGLGSRLTQRYAPTFAKPVLVIGHFLGTLYKV
ncbi:hypothetical protein [Parasediminibacterium sp. JCM 36343]